MFSTLQSEINTTGANPQRILVAELRKGDYAHPGDQEALDLILSKLLTINPQARNSKILDVGCGFGGTQEYLLNKGFKYLTAIDENQPSIALAKQKYSQANFYHLNAFDVDTYFIEQKFDVILFISSLYAMEDKEKLLAKISQISSPNATLVIFDYSIQAAKALSIKDFAGKAMYPVEPKSFSQTLKNNSWKIIETINLTKEFIDWYSLFLSKLGENKKNLQKKFPLLIIEQVADSFAYLLDQLQNNQLGGLLIYAQKQ